MGILKKNTLFRKEVCDNRRDTWLGESLLSRPVSFAFLTAGSLCMAIALLLYLVWGEYTKKARAAGYIVPDQGLIKIFPKQAGAVMQLRAAEGQQVKRGDILAIVSTERTSQQGSTQIQISRQLQSRQDSLRLDEAKTHQMYAGLIASARTRLAQLLQEQEQLARAVAAQTQRVALSAVVVERNTQLFQEKFVSELALQDKRADLLDQQSRLNDMQRSKIANERETVVLQTELANLPLKERNEIEAMERGISELSATAFENEARRGSYVLAPQDGMVTALQIDLGKQANPSLALMSLIPASTRLQADIYIPSRAVGFVRVGNTARMQYQAFPYQKFGSQPGKVIKISRTAVAPQELPFPAPAGDVYYVVTIAPDAAYVLAYGKEEPLQVGMQVGADIWLDRRTLLEWILEPLYSVSGRL